MTNFEEILGKIWQSQTLPATLETICSFGGRVAGTPGEQSARGYLAEQLQQLPGDFSTQQFGVDGYHSDVHFVEVGGGSGKRLSTTVLLNSVPTEGVQQLELIDLGRGTVGDFAAAEDRIAGKAVLVRHEFPFSTGHIHRTVKYQKAIEAGAAAFLIASYLPNTGPVAGSGGNATSADIPAFGLSFEHGHYLATLSTAQTVQLRVMNEASRHSWTGENLFSEIPGRSEKVIVLSAHIDGHGLAESAMDNGAGLATVLEVARQLAPKVAELEYGVRVALFNFEEWNLTGSHEYVAGLTQPQRDAIHFNLNIDTPVGYPRIFALTAGDPYLGELMRTVSSQGGTPIHVVNAATSNSDHYNFLQAGIRATRLIGGYDDADARTKFLLTEADTVEKIEPLELRNAAMTTASILWNATTRPGG